MVRILTLQKDEEVHAFVGFCEQEGEYYEFVIDTDWPYAQPIDGDFDNYDGFVSFITKSKPWVDFWKEPVTIDKLTYSALDRIASRQGLV